MTSTRIVPCLTALTLGLLAGGAGAVSVEVDTGNSKNGVTDIYSATFDPPLVPCTGASPPYCSFFGGDPPPTRQLVITPNPTGVINGPPGGITSPPDAAFLDLTLGAGNTQLTIAGGAVKFATLVITISGSTVVTATDAGFVFNAAPQVTSVDANGRAEFLVNLAPATAVDFSTFSEVVTSCTGPLCALIPILTLDMIRYRLVIDYDPTFTSFTGEFIGQTANNSMVFATLNYQPEITVTDSVAPADDLDVPFGDVTLATTDTQTVTVTNDGAGALVLGTVGGLDPLDAPFAVANDSCSGQTLTKAASCTFDVTFSPTATGNESDSVDIPSNDGPGSDDGAEPSVVVTVSGNGTVALVPNIVVTDSIAPASDLLLPFGSVLAGASATATVTVANNGTAPLQVGNVAGTDALGAGFAIQADSCSGQSLDPAASCTIDVAFQPGAAGPFSDSFDIPSDDPDTPSVTMNVTGTGTAAAAPNIRITDPTAPDDDRQFSFENVREGGSFDRTITVINVGTADLVLGTVGATNPLAAPFSVVAGADDCSGETLIPTGTCTVRLRFAPVALGEVGDAISVASNDPDEPEVIVNMEGTGVEPPPASSISPDGADSGFMGLDGVTLALLAAGAGWGVRRRRRAA
jgi:hypothetical protein